MSQSNGKKRAKPPRPTRAQDETELAPSTPLIIGIGASAGSIEALDRLLPKLLPSADQAIVVVLQHRESLDEQRLRKTLDAAMDGHFSALEDGAAPQGGRLYLCEPNLIVTLEGGKFHTRPAEERPGSRGTIDSFFISLAEDQGEGCLGVILYGTGGDGTLGIARIKECGGLTIAEQGPDDSVLDPATSNLPGSLADFVVPLLEIPERIRVYARHLGSLRERKGLEEMLADVSGQLVQIAVILRNKTGHDFHGYKRQTFLRRVQRRMQVVQIDDTEAYLAFLRDNPDEVQHLFNDLLIGVTQFFRDAREFEVLEREVVPKILEGKDSGDNVRVWVLGCATGEEAYSIGILIREEMARRDIHPTVQIFATDIDVRGLAAARVGRYTDSIANDVSPERLGRWFVREGNTYVVVKELREMCIFSAHNVIRDAPFSKLDLISCRNLLIYLTGELQNRVIPLFHFALLPERYLFLGNSENVSRHPKLFEPIDRRARIFRKLETPTRVLPEFPLAAARRVDGLHEARPVNTGADGGLTRRAERIAERYAPAYVITDPEFQVLHFSGRTGRYIEPNAGAASLDLLNLVHRDLRLDVRAALMKAAETNEPVRIDDLQMGVNGNQLRVDVVVEPVREGTDKRRNFVVIFKDGPVRAEGHEQPLAAAGQLRDEHVLRLESELRLTRERLQSSVEELESTNEELKSSNEEYQSLNEELQSANEELETSREELQSVNEELTTVNNELAHRVHELTRATSDLKNFLESTQIATVFLDNEMRVMNFTPAVTDIFHLVETDIGRPIAHIKSRIPFEELQEDVRRVLRTLSSIERAIEDPMIKARYIVRILPYRSTDNFIAGVVVTFVDVTPLTRAEERQKMLLAELQHRVRNTLSVVRSIARRTAETSTSVEHFAAHLEGRLSALGRVQATVTRDPASGVSLATLVAEELLAHAAHEGEQATISGPAIRLRPKAAETLALAVHELSANAVKYGALSNSSGRVRIDWKIKQADGAATLVFDWEETGGPPIDGSPRRRGFGTELLEQTLSYELKAETSMKFSKDGLACTIELPLNDRTVLEGTA
ncbi:MAG: PAS domain-containing protein [Methylobacteriaceae bacterium]|nr:PAS domain-containing protein [Methylobacteriaceae bacterium]